MDSTNVIDASSQFERASENALKAFAVKFVDLYLNASPHTAGLYSRLTVEEKDYKRVAPYIREEFEKLGYEIVPHKKED